MYFTRAQDIEEHRKMWTWIGDTIAKEKRIVFKYDYLKKHNIFYRLERNCFLCDYTIRYGDMAIWIVLIALLFFLKKMICAAVVMEIALIENFYMLLD